MTTGTQAKPFTPIQEKLFGIVVKPMSRLNPWLYRLSGGRSAAAGRTASRSCWSRTRAARPVGATRRRSSTCATARPSSRSRRRAAWRSIRSGNLRANPECEVETGRERRRMRARVADAAERAHYWPRLVAMNPDFETYRARTTREIPEERRVGKEDSRRKRHVSTQSRSVRSSPK
jgi:F420H(2)-dependent quinone reductase